MLNKCGDCIYWRKANARERRGYYFKKGAEPGKCKALTYILWVDRNHPAQCSRFKKPPVRVKNKCGDCKWWKLWTELKIGTCMYPLPKGCMRVSEMDRKDKDKCCRWEEK